MAAKRVLVFGTMRSGTTMICDLLSKPGQSLVLNEPMLRTPWRKTDDRGVKLTNVAKRFGFSKEVIDGIGNPAQPTLQWFRDGLRPELETLDLWGIKEVFLDQAAFLIDEIEPDTVILCVRDLRDVYLSALDLVCSGLLAFTGGAALRDEAWAVERIRMDVAILNNLAKRDHFVVRYESFVRSQDEQEALRSHLGLKSFGGGGTTHRESGGWRHTEADKHEGGITSRSVARHSREKDGFAATIANAVAAEHGASFLKHGADTPSAENADFLPPRPEGKSVVDEWKWNGSPGDLAYSRRRARKMLASNVKPGSRLIDIGCTLPAMPVLLQGKANVMCVDPHREGRLQYKRDWSALGLPGLTAFTDASLLVVLEWYDRDQILPLLTALSTASLTVWVAYHCVEDRPKSWAGDAMRSHLSRRDWQEIADTLKCKLVSAWCFDKHQSLLKLKRSERP